ncbi:adenylate isopentenyltransferase 3, chloroplastic-like protein [Tanacetum coccineum]|uniref:Adenylate isopentenyltransferase 3, chloroplastic-like protein n=1 Tax=Tanacetum coccineum TaxID=301880 RepID=A0ABQ4ZGI1_9ASTR
MKMTMMGCQQAQPSLLQMPTGGMDYSLLRKRPQKDKVIVVMGATGTGKSRLSIDSSYTLPGQNGPLEADFTAQNFVSTASLTMKSIVGRGKLPIIAGGSNSFIEALIDDQNYEFRSRYDVCFLWVDVAMPVLHRFVSDRVDRMVSAGIVEEVREIYNPNSDYSKGIRRAIGVPEFDAYFREEYSSSSDQKTRNKLLEEAISQTKINTCKLACRQLEKIRRLQNVKGGTFIGWTLLQFFENKGKKQTNYGTSLLQDPVR